MAVENRLEKILRGQPIKQGRTPFAAVVSRIDDSGVWCTPLGADVRHPIGPCSGATRLTRGAKVLLQLTDDGPWVLQPEVQSADTAGTGDHVDADHADAFSPLGHAHNYPVDSVNGQVGEVVLSSTDVGAASAGHGHSTGEIEGLQAELDARLAIANIRTTIADCTGVSDAPASANLMAVTYDGLLGLMDGRYAAAKAAALTGTIASSQVTGDSGWLTPTFQNGWADFSDPNFGNTQYRRGIDGRVTIRGLVAGGSLASAAFTLPPGFRPARHIIFTASAAQSFAELRVMNDGQVRIESAGSTSYVSLACTFFTDQ